MLTASHSHYSLGDTCAETQDQGHSAVKSLAGGLRPSSHERSAAGSGLISYRGNMSGEVTEGGVEQYDLTSLDEEGVTQLFNQLGFPFYDSQLAGEHSESYTRL